METLKLAYRVVKAVAYLLWTSVLNLTYTMTFGFYRGAKKLFETSILFLWITAGLFILYLFSWTAGRYFKIVKFTFTYPFRTLFTSAGHHAELTAWVLILTILAFLFVPFLTDFVKYEWNILRNFRQLILNAVYAYKASKRKPVMEQRSRVSVLATQSYNPIRRVEIHRKRNKIYVKSNFTKPLKQELSKVVGQELAKKLILSIIPKYAYERMFQAKRHKPVSFLFIGKTGVGKTELVKRVAEAMKGDGYVFFRIDANQLRTADSTQSLFGSPRGYVGSDSIPFFIQQAVKSGGKMVILIDELEKAHPEFIQAFMTLLDEGEITYTTTGERIKLNDALIFITSNLEADRIAEEASKYKSDTEKLLACKRLLENKFPPEILGRINYVIPFENLSREQFVKVIQNKLAEVKLPSDRETAEKLFNYFEKEGILKRGAREAVNTIETLAVLPDEFKKIVGPTIHVKS